jgi:hypothetical protein
VAAQEPEGKLTGNIFDHGVDTNGNGLYDYLQVEVEINVTVAGSFRVTANRLVDQFGNGDTILVYNSSQGFLDAGIWYLNLSLYGPIISGSHLNPQKVSIIELYTGNYKYLSNVNNVALSRVYNYTEFDPPHAFLTGHISDRGVDTDGDGLFNYLEVRIEFNVTEPGKYGVNVEGLLEKSATMTNYLDDYKNDTENFTAGVHTVYMDFSGSEIAYRHFNPTHVNYIYLYDSANQLEISHLDSAPLSKQYNYTLFDAPSKDIQVNFKVYPDATVAVDGTLIFTHMYPDNSYGPKVNATVGFSTTGNWTTETSNGTVVFPDSPSAYNPYSIYNGIEEHSRTYYENGLYNAAANTSEVLPVSIAGLYPYNATDVNLNAAYSRGLFDVVITGQTMIPINQPTVYSNVLPLNVSDVTVRADFDGTEVKGNITFHAVGGFPFADVRVDFSGNRSNLEFTGNINIAYASYGDLQINQTTLDQKLADLEANITGHEPNSFYNTTRGYLECANLRVTKIPWSNSTLGADVEYNAVVNGSFTGAIARMIFPQDLQNFTQASLESVVSSARSASLTLNYYHGSQIAQVDLHMRSDAQTLCNSLLQLTPPALPSSWSSQEKTQVEAWLKIANATAYALTDASYTASYSSAERKMLVNAWFSANVSQLRSDVIPVLPDAVAPNMHDLLQSYLNTAYCTTNSSMTTFDMVNGTATFASTATFQGDFEAELNNEKHFLIAALLSSSSMTPRAQMISVPWEVRLLNETEININNFQAEFELGQDTLYANFSGLILKPQADNVDVITFKLKNWLDMTADANAPPLDFEKFTVTVTGGSKTDQTVLLSQPSGVPAPDHFSGDYRSMIWNNVSLSSLKELTFLIACQKQVNYNGGTYDIPIFTNSTVKDFAFDAGAHQIAFNVTGPPGAGFCNVTIPRTLLNASALSDWTITFDGKPLNGGQFNITENAGYVFVYLNYTHSEHVITISGTSTIAEFQPDIFPLALIIPLIVAALVAIKQRRKLEPLKTRCLRILARAKLSSRSS